MFTLTKKKHTLHPKNEQGKQASGAASEVEKYQYKRPGTLETGRCSHKTLALKTTQKTITVDL